MNTSHTSFLTLLIILLISSCGSKNSGRHDRYELVIMDTLSIPFEGEVHAADYAENRGILYDYRSGKYLAFDSTGAVLVSNSLPSEGKNGLFYVNGLKILPDGEVLAHSISGEIGLLNQDLQLKEKIIMPFPNGVLDLKRNVQIMAHWQDYLLLFYPGRDNKSPYDKGYFRDNHLLERVNILTGETSPFLRLSPKSKYQEDLHFEQPTPLISVHENQLYLAFNKEPLIHRYDLGNEGSWEESISLETPDFVQIKGQSIPLGNDGSVLAEGEITGLFATENGFAVSYFEGLLQEPNRPPNSLPGQKFKWFVPDQGWSDPLSLPLELLFLLNYEGVNSPFYAIVNPLYLKGKSNEVKILKLQVKPNL